MKHLKTFKVFENESTFNVEEAMKKIKEKFDEMQVAEMFDEEVVGGGWVDDDWEEEYDSEYDWYINYGNGEAEGVVVDDITNWYESEYGKVEDTDDRIELQRAIAEEYGFFNW